MEGETMIPSSRIIDDAREKIASKFMVLCEDCGHGKNLKDDCPHLDEDVCMWQRELANDTLALSGTTDIECPVCEGKGIPRMWHGHHVETKHCPKCDNGVIKYPWKVSVVLENGELPSGAGVNITFKADPELTMPAQRQVYDTAIMAYLQGEQATIKAGYKQVVE